MPLATKKQFRESALNSTQQLDAQIGSSGNGLVNDFINITLQEIGDPAWAFDRERHHLWSWLKRKTTFTTTSGTSDYVLERDVDKIALLRQTASPTKIHYLPDELFFNQLPNPTESGNPRIYRLWEIDGVSTRLSAADTIDILSSSASDGSTFSLTVTGYVSGRLVSESYTLNGTTAVAGTNTFDAREIFVSKSGNTTGNITVRRNSNSATLVVVGSQETSPRFKVCTLFPTPNSTLTVYVEYYKRIKELVNDSDSPEFDPKWHHVVRMGTIAKIYQYIGKTNDFIATQELYKKAVRAMVASDQTNPDVVSYLTKHDPNKGSGVRLHLSEDVIV